MNRLAKKFNALEIGGLLFAGLCFIVSMCFLEKHSINAELVLEISTPETTTLEIFWRKSNESFEPVNSQKVRLTPSQYSYRIALPRISGVDFLRFDPLDKPASLQIKAAQLILSNDKILDFLPSLTRNATELQEITITRDVTDGTLQITSSGNDPNFSIPMKDLKLWNFDWMYIVVGLAVPVLLFGVVFRQDLIKGSRKRGVLTLSLPQGVLPRISAVRGMSGFVGAWQEKRKDRDLYWLDVGGIEEHLLSDLVMELKKDNPEATVRFQYNRSGEA